MKENSFILEKARSRRSPARTITDADDADDNALPANIPAQAEFHLHNLERTEGAIGFHLNIDKTDYICFNQRCDISTLNSSSLKLVDKFTYHGNSVSATKNDINMRSYGLLLIGYQS